MNFPTDNRIDGQSEGLGHEGEDEQIYASQKNSILSAF